MGKKGINRRDFLKLTGATGSLLAAGSLGGMAFPRGVWAATPAIKGPIKIGYQAIASGTLAGYGQFHKYGVEMAVEEINAAGGIAGQRVEMEFRDSTTKADTAIENCRYFVDSWGADFLAGIDSSGQALAIPAVIQRLDRVMIITHAATEKLTEDRVFKEGIRQIFRISNPTYNDGNGGAFIAKDLPAMKWATISPKYEYGYTCWKMFQETLRKLKPGVSFITESFAPFGTTDFRSHINTIMDASPDGLYSTEWAGELISFVKQAKEAGLFDKVKHVIFPVGAAMDVLEGLGKDMPDNIWISGRYFFRYPNNKTNNEWVARFRKRWDHYPAYVSETAYSAIYAIKAAVEKAGSKDTKAVIAALEGMEMDSPAGHRVFRKEDHQALYDVAWGKTKADPKYPFKVMGEMRVITGKECFARPPFEGPETSPPFKS
jgi:branched-chain amino acid transport system substrate-binding protein